MSIENGAPRYLGDGVYVVIDCGQIWLTTSAGSRTTNRICLEPEVYDALVKFVENRTRKKP